MYIHIYICVCLSSKCWCAARPPTCSATALMCKDLYLRYAPCDKRDICTYVH